MRPSIIFLSSSSNNLSKASWRRLLVMEIRFGLQTMPPQSMTRSRRQDALLRLFELLLKNMIEGRIASFDAEAGIHAAELMAQRKRAGRPAEVHAQHPTFQGFATHRD